MLEDTQQQKILRLAAWATVVVIGLVVIFNVVHYLLLATLTVTVNNPAGYVTITPVKVGDNNDSNPPFKQAQHQLKLKVSAGSYKVVATYKSYSTSEVVTVKSRQSLHITLTPVVAASPEPVYGGSSEGVVTDASRIEFLDDSNGGLLSQIDANNNVSVLYQTEPLRGIKWANTSLGLAHDDNNYLFLIHDGNVDLLNLPFTPPQNGANLSYDITPDGHIYVSQGDAIYKGTATGGFKKIYSSNGFVFSLSAGQGNVAAIESPNKNTQDPDGTVILVSDSGSVKRTKIDATQVTQSPDGNFAAVTDDSSLAVYTSPSLKRVALLPSNSTNASAWGINDNLFYNQSESLWVYGAKTHQSSKLAITPGKANILGIYPAVDASYVYYSGENTNPNADSGASQLFRIGLKNQSPDNALEGLSVFMPETLNNLCKINYINFMAPVINIAYSGPQSATVENECLGLTQSELEQYGLSPGDYQYTYSPNFQL